MNNLDQQYQALLQDILDNAYKNYQMTTIREFKKNTEELRKWACVDGPGGFTKKEFINRIKTDNEFAKTWGVDVSVRELSHTERYWLWNKISGDRCTPDCYTKEDFDNKGIPTRAISFTYNNETAESYE